MANGAEGWILMPSCRCSCKAYGGACDCRHDGLNAGRNEGERVTVARIVAWLRDPNGQDDPEMADAIESGAWKR